MCIRDSDQPDQRRAHHKADTREAQNRRRIGGINRKQAVTQLDEGERRPPQHRDVYKRQPFDKGGFSAGGMNPASTADPGPRGYGKAAGRACPAPTERVL